MPQCVASFKSVTVRSAAPVEPFAMVVVNYEEVEQHRASSWARNEISVGFVVVASDGDGEDARVENEIARRARAPGQAHT